MKKILTLAFLFATLHFFAQEEYVEHPKSPAIKENDSTIILSKISTEGNLISETTINKKNLKGFRITYYKNKNKHYTEEFTISNLTSKKIINNKIINSWNIDNVQTVINGNGNYSFENKYYKTSGIYLNGLKTGIWKFSTETAWCTELYENGKLVSGSRRDKDNNVTIYKEIETPPVFTKGEAHFKNYLINNMINLNANETSSLVGTMNLEFVVDIDGKITDIKILKKLDSLTSEQITSLLKKYNYIKPGYQRGIPIRVKHHMPVSFDMR